MKYNTYIKIIIQFFILCNFHFLYSQSFDNTFNGNGIVLTDILNRRDIGYSTLIQPDGKILVAGTSLNGNTNDLILLRFNSDGTIDTNFSENGIKSINIGSNSQDKALLGIQSDGKIILSGTFRNSSTIDIAIIRLNTDGSLDNTFGSNGMQTVNTSVTYFANDLVIQNDDKIVVGGKAYVGLSTQIAVVRFNANGVLDNSFGNEGIYSSLFPFDALAYSITIQNDMKILISGEVGNFFDNSITGFIVGRLNSNGTIDTSFNNNGFYLDNNMLIEDILCLNQKILIIGYGIFNQDAGLALFNMDGSLDSNFGTNGFQFIQIGNSFDYAMSATVDSNDKIIVAGLYKNGSDYKMALIRFFNDGSLDTSFNGTGIFTPTIGIGNDFVYSLSVQQDGKYVVCGTTYNGSNYDFLTLRFNNESLDLPLFSKSKNILYPNPTKNKIFTDKIQFFEKAEIYSINGQFIMDYSNNIDISNFESGVYFLKVFYKNKFEYFRIIKE